MEPRLAQISWIEGLSDEDIAFLKRFVLASGSLKDLAAAYEVSYPTIRLRLDRLVEKVQLLDRKPNATPFERTTLSLYADGKIDAATMKVLLAAHYRDVQHAGAKDENGKPVRDVGIPRSDNSGRSRGSSSA